MLIKFEGYGSKPVKPVKVGDQRYLMFHSLFSVNYFLNIPRSDCTSMFYNFQVDIIFSLFHYIKEDLIYLKRLNYFLYEIIIREDIK